MGFPSLLSAAPRSFTWLGKWSQPMMARLTSEIIIENETHIVATDQDLEIHTKIISERWNLACTLQNWISFQWSRAPQSWCSDKHSCFHRFYAKRIILFPFWPGFVPKFVRPPTISSGGQVVTSTPGELLREHIGFWILPCKWFLTPLGQSSWAILAFDGIVAVKIYYPFYQNCHETRYQGSIDNIAFQGAFCNTSMWNCGIHIVDEDGL